jgi:DNA-binding transcriptional ArsR family regulator
MDESVMDEIDHRLSQFFEGLGNGIRLQLVRELVGERLSVGELAETIARSNSSVSRQLNKLADKDIVQSETEGRRRYYFLKRPELVKEALALREFFERELEE